MATSCSSVYVVRRPALGCVGVRTVPVVGYIAGGGVAGSVLSVSVGPRRSGGTVLGARELDDCVAMYGDGATLGVGDGHDFAEFCKKSSGVISLLMS